MCNIVFAHLYATIGPRNGNTTLPIMSALFITEVCEQVLIQIKVKYF